MAPLYGVPGWRDGMARVYSHCRAVLGSGLVYSGDTAQSTINLSPGHSDSQHNWTFYSWKTTYCSKASFSRKELSEKYRVP